MADDWKLSIPIEADLTRLDNSLNLAQQKVAQAGARMQANMTLFPGGMTGASPIAGLSPAPWTPGVGVSFGGRLNARAASQAIQQNQTAAALMGMMPGGLGGAARAAGLPSMAGAGAIAAGAMVQIQAARYMINATEQASREGQNIAINYAFAQRAMARGDTVAATGYWAGIERNVRGIPIAGRIAGGMLDDFRQRMLYSEMVMGPESTLGRFAGTLAANPEATAAVKNRTRDLDLSARMGVFGGGFYGQARSLEFEGNVRMPAEIEAMRQQGASPASIDAYTRAKTADLGRQAQEILINRSNDIETLKTGAQQSTLRAFGAGTMADIIGIRRQYQNEINKTHVMDRERREALHEGMSAATLEAIMSGVSPAQQFTPGSMELGTGAVRTGPGMFRDSFNVGVYSELRKISGALGESIAQVMR